MEESVVENKSCLQKVNAESSPNFLRTPSASDTHSSYLQEVHVLKSAVDGLQKLHSSAVQEQNRLRRNHKEEIESLKKAHTIELADVNLAAEEQINILSNQLQSAIDRAAFNAQAITEYKQRVRNDAKALIQGEQAAWKVVSKQHHQSLKASKLKAQTALVTTF